MGQDSFPDVVSLRKTGRLHLLMIGLVSSVIEACDGFEMPGRMINDNPSLVLNSVWKSSPGTGERPGPDWTVTSQDRKKSRPVKTVTAVQSSVFQYAGNSKLDRSLIGLFHLI
jgi:hypothetical protein